MAAATDYPLILGLCLLGISSATFLMLRSEDLDLARLGRTVVLYLVLLPAMVLGLALCIAFWLES